MHAAEIRFLFAYDRWATHRVLAVLDGVDAELWGRPNRIGDRGLGGILFHQYAAALRWRLALQSEGEAELPQPEGEPLPTIAEIRGRWGAEWAAVDAWLPNLTDGFVSHVHEGVPVWQMLVHAMNHGTQHRAEAAALLTAEGRSPGDLDLIVYAEDQAHPGSVQASDRGSPDNL